jgi:hypothetical protein
LCAIFSGSTCTIQNSTMPAIGMMMMTNQATPQDMLSISAGGKKEACAAEGSTKAPAVKVDGGGRRSGFMSIVR